MDSKYDELIENMREDALQPLSERLKGIYASATEEMTIKLEEYLSDVERRDSNMLDLLENGEISERKYNQWRLNQMTVSKDWTELRDNLALTAVNADNIATLMINDSLLNIYADSFNLAHYVADIQGGKLYPSFQLYNAQTVKKLVEDNIITLPYAHPDSGKDFLWNQQHINATVTHGILTGDSVKKIASNMSKVTGMDYNVAMRNARTCHNSAQNQANFDACKKINENGIPMKIVWSTARDSRTRDTHIIQEGMERNVGEEFPNGLRFPLDVEKGFSMPSEIYNCRCKGLTFIKGIDHSKDISNYDAWMKENYFDDWQRARFDQKTGKIRDIWKGNNPNVDTLIEEAQRRLNGEKTKKASVSYPLRNVDKVVGSNIAFSLTRRSDEFKFAIEDVMNQQGFDGLPSIVSAEEFNKAVKESKFIAQRTYSANNQEILEEYRNQLYNGKWYVDCSTGGAQYGQGMYCAGDYTGKLSQGIKIEMKHYQDLNTMRGNPLNYTETLTLKPDAKIIKYKDLRKQHMDFEDKLYENAFENMVNSGAFGEYTNDIKKRMIQAKEWDYTGESLAYASFDKKVPENVVELWNEKAREIDDYYSESGLDNLGVYGASLGYDAINAEGHGQSGSYTVVLNRTALIIKGE